MGNTILGGTYANYIGISISNEKKIIKFIKTQNRVSMADISTLDEGIACANMDVDILSTTLSGYTQYSPLKNNDLHAIILLRYFISKRGNFIYDIKYFRTIQDTG